MPLLYRLTADAVVILHAGYVSYVLIGQLLILVGILCRWSWIRNPWFRWTHLAAILIVVVESLLEITCPLTTLEQYLRRESGTTAYQGDFVGNWVHELLFFDFTPDVFTAIYTAFGLVVLATFLLVPPRRRRT
ncbi:MAG: DUF2784 domain-containing protein [Planctomycetaceae bacterium]|nr:DUF2784 domain-containing protein [Planctomycetaceae bacterium]